MSIPVGGPPTSGPGAGRLVDEADVVLLDLDGVVYRGPAAVPHAVQTLNRIGDEDRVRLTYVTNNASRPPEEVAEHLCGLGLVVAPTDVVTSAQAGARLLADRVPAGAPVLAVGGPGLTAALAEVGLRAVPTADEGPVAVLQGFDPGVGWTRLAEASYVVATGVPWVATNTDLTIPTARGTAPGNGTLVAAVAAATGRDPVVAGKPEPPLMLESVRRTGARRPLVVGDRLDTDIAGAAAIGAPSLLVLTGVSGPRELLGADGPQRPTHLGADLRALLGPPRVAVPSRRGWVCGRWRARVGHEGLEIEVHGGRAEIDSGDGGDESPDEVDALRAACAAWWESADGGRALPAGEAASALAEALAQVRG